MPVFEVRPRFTVTPITVVADSEDDARDAADRVLSAAGSYSSSDMRAAEVKRLGVLQILEEIQNGDLDEFTAEMVGEVIVAVNTLQAMVTSLERRSAKAFLDGTAARVLLDTVKDFLAGI